MKQKHIILVFLLSILSFNAISQVPKRAMCIHSGDNVTIYDLPDNADGFKVEKVEYTSLPAGYENGHPYLDLGLPSGTKWALCNLGANTPLEFGNHYAWGESEPEPSLKYDWNTYKYCISDDKGNLETLTKYCLDSSYGEIDDLQYIEPSDDPVSVEMGGRWRMPTVEQYEELGMNCDFIRGVVDGVYGVAIISRINGAALFVPAAGIYLSNIYVHPSNPEVSGIEYCGAYWATKLDEDNSLNAYVGYFTETQINMMTYYRCLGLSLRGACIINE